MNVVAEKRERLARGEERNEELDCPITRELWSLLNVVTRADQK